MLEQALLNLILLWAACSLVAFLVAAYHGRKVKRPLVTLSIEEWGMVLGCSVLFPIIFTVLICELWQILIKERTLGDKQCTKQD